MIQKEDLKAIRERALADCSPETAFYVCDGTVLRNLQQLADIIPTMGDEVFKYHVNADKNDFANWINDILGDSKLAQKLKKIKTQQKYSETVAQRLKEFMAKA